MTTHYDQRLLGLGMLTIGFLITLFAIYTGYEIATFNQVGQCYPWAGIPYFWPNGLGCMGGYTAWEIVWPWFLASLMVSLVGIYYFNRGKSRARGII